ncbi:N-acetylmuramoyl-L-alanine amidase [Porphyromonas pogonae]|uniref:N-acetylmuramoyl-L-alanine amidase n=1 Tax=Porphyromonas pogonae TaxID=867595 RepID=UPI002E78788F|nr:N-acetylmuramoyl-L-alanine amidase [Porphyromonas pogonae]
MKKQDVRYIIIHCSATRCNMTYTAFQLDQDHRMRGFKMAGYHFYIRRDGEIESMRPTNHIGAHTLGYNSQSIGICYEGGLSTTGKAADTRTDAQKRAIIRLLRVLRADYPYATVCGHRDLSPDRNKDGMITHDEWLKECPCFDALREYARL